MQEKTKPAKFTKDELIASKKFKDKRVILNCALDANRTYTVDEAEKLITKYLSRKVD